MINFQQGDQYAIPITIKQGSVTITPSNCTDVRVKINNELKSYLENTLTYNTTKKVWEYPLTEEFSRRLTSETPVQIGVKQGTDVFYSTVQLLDFSESIITEEWT